MAATRTAPASGSFQPLLECVIRSTGSPDLRDKCDPAAAACLRCCAIIRAMVRWWAASPPCDETWVLTARRADVVAELERLAQDHPAAMSASCDHCAPYFRSTCAGGSSSTPRPPG
jgi:hypothetical protein